MAENKKGASSAEDVATWLARETGHVDIPEEGYGEEDKPSMLPAKKRKSLSKFFDGLQVEKAMQEQRRGEALADVDDAAALRQAIAPRLSEGPPNATAY